MKLFLIKIGKALSVLKRDGFLNGGRRIWRAFFAPFKRVGSGDVLFITGGVGDSALYRTYHIAENLELHGFKCSTTVQDNPFLAGYADKFKIFIFHRVLSTPRVSKLIQEIKKQKKEIIFETDDLVFDTKYYKDHSYFKNMNYFTKKLYEKGVGGEILKDEYVKTCTCTTSYLAKELEEYNKKVFIVPNKLSNKDLEIVDEIMKHETCNMKHETQEDEKRCFMLHDSGYMIKIGYFSGVAAHNKDFSTITETLMKIMEKYPQVRLFLVGPLDIESKLNKFKNRISQFPYVIRKKHFSNIASVDINIVPLEMNNPFCEAKSELKFFEAGILEVPTVAVRNQTFSEAITDGENGFLARTENEWFEKLEKLILDENLRKSMGEKAREKSLKDYTNKNSHSDEYYNYLRKQLT
jgi:glycosyltransferase involved in cell wall biosynthesis